MGFMDDLGFFSNGGGSQRGLREEEGCADSGVRHDLWLLWGEQTEGQGGWGDRGCAVVQVDKED